MNTKLVCVALAIGLFAPSAFAADVPLDGACVCATGWLQSCTEGAICIADAPAESGEAATTTGTCQTDPGDGACCVLRHYAPGVLLPTPARLLCSLSH